MQTVIDPDASLYKRYFKTYIVAWQSSYLTSLGEFSGSLENYDEIDWIVFFLATIINIILLLNLLIAIVSETFAAINESTEQTSYKEKAHQMVNMQDGFSFLF